MFFIKSLYNFCDVNIRKICYNTEVLPYTNHNYEMDSLFAVMYAFRVGFGLHLTVNGGERLT